MSKPETAICTYRVKPEHEAEFVALLGTHWQALRGAGLVTETKPQRFRAILDPKDRHSYDTPTYVEIFEWRDAQAPGTAHELPEVMAVWEPMGRMCSDMSFPHFEPLEV